jgi:1-acyl-sn-glycerol-3-phosphate acyltransferase
MFGPLKYGTLPDLLGQDDLVGGNALIEMGTFLSILLGTIAGGVLVAAKGGPVLVAGAGVGVAVLGFVAAGRIPRGVAAAPELRVSRGLFKPTWELLQIAREPRSVFNSILGISWFWLLGAAVLSILPGLVTKHLGGDESVVTYLLALFSIGVAVGSLLCEKLSFRQLELGLVPIGSLGITVCLGATALLLRPEGAMHGVTVGTLVQSAHGIQLSFALGAFAVASGLFIVPLYTLLQERSEPSLRSRVIAANNVANAAFMVIGAALLVGFFALGASIPQILGILAVLNLCAAVYIYTVIPEFAFRFVCWMLAHVLYRLKIDGKDRIPASGAAVLVCNHVTFIDWLVISAASQRPMRFVMHHGFLELPLTGRFFRDVKVIPIAGAKENKAIYDAAFTRIAAELAEGELLCIFPEGKLTADGEIAPFRTGIERILAESPVPVIPMHLGGLWQSFFSRHKPKKLFRRVWSRVRLDVGDTLPPTVTAAELEARVRALAAGGISAASATPLAEAPAD